MTVSNRDLSTLKNQQFDIVIIGGGITGAWLSLHCAQQGYKTALIEKHDYASQTSSSSSKLLHGGIRYLQQFQFDKVRESAMERAEYLYAAPHLSQSVAFLIPTYTDFKRSKFFLNCGMMAYRFLSLGENKIISSKEQNLPKNHSLNATELNQIYTLDDDTHTGAVVFYERHMLDSERMVLSILQTAKNYGAQAYNYISATGFVDEKNHIKGIHAKDELCGETFEVNAKLVINACGPFMDNLNTKLNNAKSAPKINGFAVGSHIITRQLSEHAIALTTKHQSDAKLDRGGRHIFIIPWRGYSLIGTSYNEIDSPNENLSIQSDHVDQLLDAVNEGIPNTKLSRLDIISGYSGLYPLHTDNINSTVYQGSGEYQITDHESANGVSGVISALGAKFTTGRKISELTMKVIEKKLGRTNIIKRTKLHDSDYSSLATLIKTKTAQYKERFSKKVIEHLIMCYGSNLDVFLSSIENKPELSLPICNHQPDLLGQVVWAVKHEQAITLNDIIYRRTSLGLLGIKYEELTKVAQLMATELQWSPEHLQQQLNISEQGIKQTQNAINGGTIV